MTDRSPDKGDALARARAAALAELRSHPTPISWRQTAARLGGAFVATGLLVVVGAAVASLARPDEILARGPWLLALLVFGALAAVVSIAPGAAHLRIACGALGVSLMMLLVAWRGPGLPSTTPGWVCSASHFALDLIPLGVALMALRQSAWRWSRALIAGLGAGASGALLGELACHQGARHVLVHHIGAWLAAAIVCVLVARRLRPRTFAP